MRNILFLYIFLFFSNKGFTQIPSTYNYFINKAELNFIENKYDSALLNFGFAFKERKQTFAKDYYNASLCAARINKLKLVNEYMDSLLQLGYDMSKIEKVVDFKPYINSSFYKLLTQKAKIKNAESPIITNSNKKLIEQIRNDDQYFRSRNPSDYMKHEFATVIRQIDSINSFKLLNFIDKYGYPNEYNTGLFENSLIYTDADVIIMHQGEGAPNRVINFSNSILNCLKQEQILPHKAVYLYNIQNGQDTLFGSDCFYSLEQTDGEYKYAYVVKFSNEKENRYNENRLLYNLESLDDYRKKVLFFIKNMNDFIFDFLIGVTIQKYGKAVTPYMKHVTYID